jgi:hypothetical protein
MPLHAPLMIGRSPAALVRKRNKRVGAPPPCQTASGCCCASRRAMTARRGFQETRDPGPTSRRCWLITVASKSHGAARRSTMRPEAPRPSHPCLGTSLARASRGFPAELTTGMLQQQLVPGGGGETHRLWQKSLILVLASHASSTLTERAKVPAPQQWVAACHPVPTVLCRVAPCHCSTLGQKHEHLQVPGYRLRRGGDGPWPAS